MSEASRMAIQAYYDTYYPEMIRKITANLTDGANGGNSISMTGPSGGVVRLGDSVFAIDPAICGEKGLEASVTELRDLFSHIPLVFITHSHSDHFDRKLTAVLADLPIKWVIPYCISEDRITESGLKRENILRTAPGDRLMFGDLCIEVFDGMHHDADSSHGCDAVGYYITFNSRSLLIMGDVRQYDPKFFPVFPSVDSIFMGVWLGREKALEPDAVLLEQYCRFIAAYAPEKAFLWHLYQSARKLPDMWDYTHSALIMDRLLETNPEIETVVVKTGCRYPLFY